MAYAGIVTAYGAAVRGGYTGTYEEFCAQQANYAASAAAVEQAKQDAESAADRAESAAETFSVDLALNKTSTHPVQNQTVTQAIDTINNALGKASGETLTPTSTSNNGLEGAVGQTISTWATTTYWNAVYAVTVGKQYAITTTSDMAAHAIVWFTNASNVVLEVHKALAVGDVNLVCTAPTGATKLYVMSYGWESYLGFVQKIKPVIDQITQGIVAGVIGSVLVIGSMEGE